mgnify:CR=1 FL=1
MTGELTGHLNQVDQEAREQVETLGKADGGETGCDRTTENAGSDEMGWIDE